LFFQLATSVTGGPNALRGNDIVEKILGESVRYLVEDNDGKDQVILSNW
jgi:hypothetical protein